MNYSYERDKNSMMPILTTIRLDTVRAGSCWIADETASLRSYGTSMCHTVCNLNNLLPEPKPLPMKISLKWHRQEGLEQLHHIVIVGGGAGGLELATRLGKKLVKRNLAKVTLVDKSLTHLWKPLLHEVAAGTLDSHEDELNYFTHASSHHFQFQLGIMQGLNRSNKEILLDAVLDEHGEEIVPARKLSYDTLVIAVGSITNDFTTSGVQEYGVFLDSTQQAEKFQQQFLKNLMQAQNQTQPLVPGQLDIAIVGAGATGVELAAELHYTVRQAVTYGLDKIKPEQDVTITLIEAADRILPALPKRLSKATETALRKLNIKVMKQARVTEFTINSIKTASGLSIPAATKVWAAGIKGAEFLKHLDDLAVNRINQLMVKPNLQTTIDDNIFALGDCASCPQNNDTNKTVPPRAQAAHQQASLLTKTLQQRLQNKPITNYHYRDYGSLVSLSRHTTTGSLMGKFFGNIFIEGKIARLVYLSLYKMHLIALHGVWRVSLMTLANLLTRRLKPRLKLH